MVTCDDAPPLHANHLTVPQSHVTQATFPFRELVTSHNSLHVNRSSGARTGFGVPTAPNFHDYILTRQVREESSFLSVLNEVWRVSPELIYGLYMPP